MQLIHALSLPLKTPSNNEIKGMHWSAYRKLRMLFQQHVWAAVNGKLPKQPIDVAFLVVRRYSAGEGLDWDNAYGGLKPLLDCLVMQSGKNPDGLGFIVDDNQHHMPEPPYLKQLSATQLAGRTEVFIFEGCPDSSLWQALREMDLPAMQP